ncbi:MAG: undecaprenyldiphospho-muramoylpentapeptide beta-N-acetylglucosaminyltransferase [Pseudopedobacter sp.]|nr:undecaprenyldiphospho-muramoylpentapeptide beta-N-acetylglucosaminyltransferase [Deinococcales bacterium]
MSNRTVVLSTGGTGGHIYPAVALARELVPRGFDVVLIGQTGGMEQRICSEENIAFYGVHAGKIDRGRPNPLELIQAGRGLLEARKLLQKIQPLTVVGFGGFASLPGILAAQSLHIPTVLHEQNAQLGLTQRLAARGATLITTAYPEVKGLKSKESRWVGVPVREERMNRKMALQKLGLQDGPLTLLVMGGSQGSLALNTHVPGALEGAFGREGILKVGSRSVQVLHSSGRAHLTTLAPQVRHLEWYRVRGFIDAVAAWSCADLAITRAGSSTLGEAAFHGVPLCMVPLPSSAENHQMANAKAVENAGAGRTILQEDLNHLPGVLLDLLNRETMGEMRDAARGLCPAGAAARLANEVEAVVRMPKAR